jgi:anti-sigma-K factor RskA
MNMKKQKLNQLFELARTETAPEPSPDFAADVLRAVRREPAARRTEPLSVCEQLNRWFPRVALATAAVMLVCVAANYGLTAAGLPGLDDSMAQMSSQLFFNVEDL